jgi:uncharacterized protein YmfQ (DUF2313 family)
LKSNTVPVMNHRDVLAQLMPVELGENHQADMALDGAALDAVAASADRLLANVFADTAIELLPSWERVLGLAPADGASTTARSAAVVAKKRERGGLSIPYFIQLAADMGYEIEIVEHHPFMTGISGIGDELMVEHAFWHWEVTILNADDVVHPFRIGESTVGDPLLWFDQGELEKIIEDLKPAETHVYFTYP